MSKSTPETNPIERLLQDRAQFVSWLTRLNSSDGVPTVPEGVRSRVRADYERRLEAVLTELRGHTSALEEQVAGLTARANELAGKESELKEQLSEAEVRHVVGEYDDGKWDGIRAELTKVILALREELTNTGNEVNRLNDVLGTIRAPVLTEAAAPPAPAPPPPAPPPPPPAPAPTPPPITHSAPRPAINNSGPRPAMPEMIPLTPEPPEAPEPARPAASATELPFRAITPKVVPNKPAAAPKADAPGRTLWFPSGKPNEGGQKLDELAFLKSVTDEEASAHMAPAAPAPPPPAPTPPPPAPKPPRPSGGFTKPATIEPAAEAKPAQDKDRASGGQKTLKCGECGTLNRPTEWYCERCGAELAAL